MSRCTATTPALPVLARNHATQVIRYAAESADISDRKMGARGPQHGATTAAGAPIRSHEDSLPASTTDAQTNKTSVCFQADLEIPLAGTPHRTRPPQWFSRQGS